MGRERLAAVLVLAAVSAAACGSAAETGGPADDLQGEWELVSGFGPDGDVELPPGYRVTLAFEGGRVGGRSACNTYGGSARVSGDRVTIDALSMTEMGCEPDVMEAEVRYLGALQGVERLRVGAERLVLTGPGAELAFAPVPPVPNAGLVGTVWELDTLVNGDTASSVAGGATLRLDAGGGIEATTGCRTLAGRYVMRGGEVVVTELATDGGPGACPPATARQDELVARVVGDGFEAQVEGDRLTLTAFGGDGLVYRAR